MDTDDDLPSPPVIELEDSDDDLPPPPPRHHAAPMLVDDDDLDVPPPQPPGATSSVVDFGDDLAPPLVQHGTQISFEFVDVSDELRCAICLDPFDNPVELKPCGHLFCTACAASLTCCPECRGNIASRSQPNRIIRNMAAEASLRCSRCGWRGTRSTRATHTTCNSAQHQRAGYPPVVVGNGSNSSSGYPPMMSAPGGFSNGSSSSHNSGAYNTSSMPHHHHHHHHNHHRPPPPGGRNGYPEHPSMRSSGSFNAQSSSFLGSASASGYPDTAAAVPPRRGQAQRVIASEGHPAPWQLYGLSQVEYDQAVSIFYTFDEDGTGRLSRSELTKLARWLNFAQQPGDIDRMFREMDLDRTGTLSSDEFCTWLCHNKPDPQSLYGLPQSEYNCVMMQFRAYDANGDGRLALPEFQRLCEAMRYYTHREAAEVFRMIDLDQSGAIDLHEFLTFRSRGATGAPSSQR